MSNSIYFMQPAEALCNYIQNYYMVEFKGTSDILAFEQKTLSNGCVELFIGYENNYGTYYNSAGCVLQPDSAIVGTQNLRHNINGTVKVPERKVLRFVSVNFKPGGFYEIFKIPSSEIYSGFFDTREILGHRIRYMQEKLSSAKNNQARRQCLDDFLMKQLHKNSSKQYHIKAGFEIARFIEERKGNVRINEMVNEFNVTERTLQRDLKKAFGLSLKEYCKINRFKNMFEYINTQPSVNWADVVSLFGYYDQAHMINEFRAATGITPNIFLKYKNKHIFKIDNHLVILQPNVIHDEIREALAQGEESYRQISINNFKFRYSNI